MTPDVIAFNIVAIAATVSAIIGQFVKPLVEALPFANPANKAAYNAPAHDALLRAANVALNVVGVLLLALWHGQLTTANWPATALQVAAQAIGSHYIYQAVKPSAPVSAPVVVSNAAVAQALNDAIQASQASPAPAQAAPLHQQAAPAAASAI